MMQFRTVRDAIIQTLGDDAAGRYQVVSFQAQGSGREERELPTVTVYYREGDFPADSGSITGPNQHDTEYAIQLMVLGASKGDLSGLQSATTPSALAAAIATFNDAADEADTLFDKLADDVYQVLMDTRNETFGLSIGAVSSRWVSNIRKDEPVPQGQQVILTGNMRLICRVEETVLGEDGTAGTEFDSVIDIDGDDVEQTGAAGTLGGS